MIEGVSLYSRPLPWKLIPGVSGAPLVLLLHGFRQNKEKALRYWSSLKGKVHLLAPDGPLVHEFNQPRKIGHAWYVYDGDRDKFLQEMETTSESLNKLVKEASRHVDSKNHWVCGFSQGAYLALYYGLCTNSQVTHVHSVAGNLNINLIKESLKDKKVWLHHTDNDPVCPVSRMEELEGFLREKECQVERRCFSGQHQLLPEMMEPLETEFKKILAS